MITRKLMVEAHQLLDCRSHAWDIWADLLGIIPEGEVYIPQLARLVKRKFKDSDGDTQKNYYEQAAFLWATARTMDMFHSPIERKTAVNACESFYMGNRGYFNSEVWLSKYDKSGRRIK